MNQGQRGAHSACVAMMLDVALGADADAAADDDVIGMIDIDAPGEGEMADVFPVFGCTI